MCSCLLTLYTYLWLRVDTTIKTIAGLGRSGPTRVSHNYSTVQWPNCYANCPTVPFSNLSLQNHGEMVATQASVYNLHAGKQQSFSDPRIANGLYQSLVEYL